MSLFISFMLRKNTVENNCVLVTHLNQLLTDSPRSEVNRSAIGFGSLVPIWLYTFPATIYLRALVFETGTKKASEMDV